MKNGQAREKHQYKYDEHRRIIEGTLINIQGIAIRRETDSYDARGNVTQKAQYDWHKIMFLRETYTYDEFDAKGNWTKRHTYKEEVLRAGPASETDVDYRTITYY